MDPCQPHLPVLVFLKIYIFTSPVLSPPWHVDPGQCLPLPVRHHRGHHVLLHGRPQAPEGLPGGPPVAGGEDEPGGAESAAGVTRGLGGPRGSGEGLGPGTCAKRWRGACWGCGLGQGKSSCRPCHLPARSSPYLLLSHLGRSSSSPVPGAPPVYLSPSGGGPACPCSLFTGRAPA